MFDFLSRRRRNDVVYRCVKRLSGERFFLAALEQQDWRRVGDSIDPDNRLAGRERLVLGDSRAGDAARFFAVPDGNHQNQIARPL